MRRGGDADDEMRDLAGIPLDPVPHLQDGEAVATDHVAVLAHAVRDGDGMAEEGVRRLLPPAHAAGIAGLDAAGGSEELARLGNGRRLVGRRASSRTSSRAIGMGEAAWGMGGRSCLAWLQPMKTFSLPMSK